MPPPVVRSSTDIGKKYIQEFMMKSSEVVCVREYRELWETTEQALRNGLRYQAHLQRNQLGKHGSSFCKAMEHLRIAESIVASELTEIEDKLMLEAA